MSVPIKRDTWIRSLLWPAVGGLVATAGALLFLDLPEPWPKVVEGAHYLFWLGLLFGACRPLRRMLRDLPRPQRVALLGFIGVMIAPGQGEKLLPQLSGVLCHSPSRITQPQSQQGPEQLVNFPHLLA